MMRLYHIIGTLSYQYMSIGGETNTGIYAMT